MNSAGVFRCERPGHTIARARPSHAVLPRGLRRAAWGWPGPGALAPPPGGVAAGQPRVRGGAARARLRARRTSLSDAPQSELTGSF